MDMTKYQSEWKKNCSESVTIPLEIICEESLKKDICPEIWEKTNIVPVHKKEDKALPVHKKLPSNSLLPIFEKLFERIIYNSLLNHFLSNKLFTPSQSGFIPGDSFIAQLSSIIHKIQTVFNNNPAIDGRHVFLDISKAFDKIGHDGLISN